MLDKILLEDADERLTPANKLLQLAPSGDTVYVSVEVQEEDNLKCVLRTITDSEAKENDSDMPMKAMVAVDLEDLIGAVLACRRREQHFELRREREEKLKAQVEERRALRDLEAGSQRANERVRKIREEKLEVAKELQQIKDEKKQLEEQIRGLRYELERRDGPITRHDQAVREEAAEATE